MKDAIEFLLAYPTWVKVSVVTLALAIVVLLLFTHPPSEPKQPAEHSAQQQGEFRDRDSLVAILDERSNQIASNIDEAISRLDGASSKGSAEQEAARAKLTKLKADFLSLHKKHVAAITAGDIQLTHELNGDIHVVLSEINSILESRVGQIGNKWFGGIRRRYLAAPEPGEDPEFAGVQQDIAALRANTVTLVKSTSYPGEPPISISAELRELAFGSPRAGQSEGA